MQQNNGGKVGKWEIAEVKKTICQKNGHYQIIPTYQTSLAKCLN